MIFLVLVLIFGLCLGSFLNAVIWRLKNDRSICFGRSVCPDCGQKLSAAELVPLLSFGFQRGRCRHCHQKISWQYPLVELTVSGLFVLISYYHFGYNFPVGFKEIAAWLKDLVISFLLTGIFVFDLKYYLIPDHFTIPGVLVAALLNLYLGVSWQSLAVGILVGSGVFAIQYLVSRGEWVGSGDIRLGALMGAVLGWPVIVPALFLAYFAGSIWAIGLLITGKKQWRSQLPFGAFLSPATLVAMYWGQTLIDWYLGLL